MARFVHYDLTLTGGNDRVTTDHKPICFIRIENEAGNDDLLYGDSDLSATSYGGRVPAEVASGVVRAHTLGPFPAGYMNLEDIYFRGTADDVIHLVVVHY